MLDKCTAISENVMSYLPVVHCVAKARLTCDIVYEQVYVMFLPL